MKISIIKLTVIAAITLIFTQITAQKSSGYKVSKTFHIASLGGWDYIAVDENSNRLYVSHGTQVNILDKTTGDSLGVILNTTGIHGIAFNQSLGKGYTSNGRLNTVTVFDLKTAAVLSQIKTGENPDAIMYDEFSKKIITCNGRSKDLTIIDPITETVVATIPVGGKPETAVSDNNGKLYVNSEDKNEIVVVDMVKYTVLNHWTLAPGEEPTGLVIDLKTKRLFATCDKLLVAMDATDGKIIAQLPIGEGCDGAAFDPSTNLIFTSNGSAGTVTVVKEQNANSFAVVETITTKKSARTITIDTKSHHLYLPAADMEALPADAPKGSRPKMVAGSFQVLVLTK
ncbi:MAG: YncE family protein [Bacteroidetes bacterium]|nr:YncE family protein [Bacteroidota bacterium]